MKIRIEVSNDKRHLAEVLAQTAGSEASEQSLVLVPNQLTERTVRRFLQERTRRPAPRIAVLEIWMDQLAHRCLSALSRPPGIIGPRDRELFLQEWLRSHENPALRKLAHSPVNVLSGLIADLRHSGVDPEFMRQNGNGSDSALSQFFREYERMLHTNNRIDREQLPYMIDPHCRPFIPEPDIILYEPGYLFESQKKGLSELLAILKPDENISLHLIQYASQHDDPALSAAEWLEHAAASLDIDCSVESTFNESVRTGLAGRLADNGRADAGLLKELKDRKQLFISEHHSPRDELEHCFRLIRLKIAQTKAGEFGSRFSDYIILVTDMDLYQPLIEPVSRLYEVPAACSAGPVYMSNPVIRRFLVLLSLHANQYAIDDIYQVFADNQFTVPELEEDDAGQRPNIRSFCEFCRKYNLRTLPDAEQRIDAIAANLEKHIRSRDGLSAEEIQARIERHNRDIDYYHKIIDRLNRFRSNRQPKATGEFRQWTEWTKKMIATQPNLHSPEANQAKNLLEETVESLDATFQRLDLKPVMKIEQYLELLELSLKQNRERPREGYENVLVTEAGYYGETHDRITFLVGMSEGKFPSPPDADYLRFRYQQELRPVTDKAGPAPYGEARRQLLRQLENAPELYMSRPVLIGDKPVIGSALWEDLQQALGIEEDDALLAWPEPDKNIMTSRYELRRHKGQQPGLPIEQLCAENAWPEPVHLITSVRHERHNVQRMGLYDGVLSEIENPAWRDKLNRTLDAWWNRVTAGGQFGSSISQLDKYAESPLEFFFRYVLNLEPPEQYTEEAESSVKGIILHKILQEFYTAGSEYAPGTLPPVIPGEDNLDDARKRLETIMDNVIGEYRDQMGYAESPFPGILSRHLKRTLNGFLQEEMKRDELLEPDIVRTLVPVGMRPDQDKTMEYHWEHRIRIDGIDTPVELRGIIDRIDADDSGKRALILDYKSGMGSRNFKKEINFGTSFQLPVYTRMLMEEGVESPVGAYFNLPVDKSRSKISLNGFMGDETWFRPDVILYKNGNKKSGYEGVMSVEMLSLFLDRLFEERISWIIRHIRKGVFNLSFSAPSDYSDFRYITRYEKSVQDERAIEEVKQVQERSGDRPRQQRYYVPIEILTSEDFGNQSNGDSHD